MKLTVTVFDSDGGGGGGGESDGSFQPYIRSVMERERVRARDRITAEGKIQDV